MAAPANNTATAAASASGRFQAQVLHGVSSLAEQILNKQNEILKMAYDPDNHPNFDWFIDPELYTMTSRLKRVINSEQWRELPFAITKDGIKNDKFMQQWLGFDVTSRKARPLMTGERQMYLLSPEERARAVEFYSRQLSSISHLWDTILEKNKRDLLKREREAFGDINYTSGNFLPRAGTNYGRRMRRIAPDHLQRQQTIAMHQASISMHEEAIKMHQHALESVRAALATYQGLPSRQPAMPPMQWGSFSAPYLDNQQFPAIFAGMHPMPELTTGGTYPPAQSNRYELYDLDVIDPRILEQPISGEMGMHDSNPGGFTAPASSTQQPMPPAGGHMHPPPLASNSTGFDPGFSTHADPQWYNPVNPYQPFRESPLRHVVNFEPDPEILQWPAMPAEESLSFDSTVNTGVPSYTAPGDSDPEILQWPTMPAEERLPLDTAVNTGVPSYTAPEDRETKRRRIDLVSSMEDLVEDDRDFDF